MMINNLPNYAKNMEFIVVREYDGEYWFWGRLYWMDGR